MSYIKEQIFEMDDDPQLDRVDYLIMDLDIITRSKISRDWIKRQSFERIEKLETFVELFKKDKNTPTPKFLQKQLDKA